MATININNADTLEKMIFGGRLPRSAEFALMLENINAVEETPATKKRRQFIASITTFGQLFRDGFAGQAFARGGVYKPRPDRNTYGLVGHSGPEAIMPRDRRWTLDRRNRK